jgi:hypothetical protein
MPRFVDLWKEKFGGKKKSQPEGKSTFGSGKSEQGERREARKARVQVKEISFTPEQIGTRSQFPNNRVLESPQSAEQPRREYAERILDVLLTEKKGMIIFRAKVVENQAAIGDARVTAVGGKLTSLDEGERIFEGRALADFSKKEDRMRRYAEDGSVIMAYYLHADEAKRDAHNTRPVHSVFNPELQKTNPQFEAALDQMGDQQGGVVYLEHNFPSGTGGRGSEKIHASCMYIFPGELGLKVEAQIAQDPWLMEAMTELVIERANNELRHRTSHDFYVAQGSTSLVRPSLAPTISKLLEYYLEG